MNLCSSNPCYSMVNRHQSQHSRSSYSSWDWKHLGECWGVNWSLCHQPKLRQVAPYQWALSGRKELKVHHWLPELQQISSSCIVKTWPLLHREAKQFDLINKVLSHHFKTKFPSKGTWEFHRGRLSHLGRMLDSQEEASALQLQKQLIFKKKFILHKGILNAE